MGKLDNCSKCHSENFLELERKGISESSPYILIKLSSFKTKRIDPVSYLCLDCGYIEHWIKNENDRELISKNKNELQSFL